MTLSSQSLALNILLTNDDGISGAGVQALKVALRTAGHNVLVVAPNGEASGSSLVTNDFIKSNELLTKGNNINLLNKELFKDKIDCYNKRKNNYRHYQIKIYLRYSH